MFVQFQRQKLTILQIKSSMSKTKFNKLTILQIKCVMQARRLKEIIQAYDFFS